ncbi:MAG: TRAP transporter TatT component family protein [Vicinamibacterales bacterium]
MTSCIFVLYLATSGTLSAGVSTHLRGTLSPGSIAQTDADVLYAQRGDIASARRAAEIWAQQLRNTPADFDAAWKLARARFWLGSHANENERKAFLESGIAAGRAAAGSRPNRPEGHFWTAANMGALAESFGLRQGLKYRGTIREELMTVLRLDPAFQQGSADRALGRWYLKVPGMFGGSKKQSEEHLRTSLTYNQNSISSRFFLAETLLEMDRKTEALAELQRVGGLQPDPEWVPEDQEFKQKAQRLLATLLQRR